MQTLVLGVSTVSLLLYLCWTPTANKKQMNLDSF